MPINTTGNLPQVNQGNVSTTPQTPKPISYNLPQEAKDILLKDVQNYNKARRAEGKDFKFTCSKSLELTNADRANKTTEKWCVRMEYIIRFYYSEEWSTWSDEYHSYEMLKTNGVFQTGSVCECQQ